jgi:hypothetical protein
LKVFLSDIISEEKIAFVTGRLIMDNLWITYECLHTIRRQQSKTPFFALKIDMMKAYDGVEWAYLPSVLNKLVFHDLCISTVMRCACSVNYAIRINGELTQTFLSNKWHSARRSNQPISFSRMSSLLKKKEEDTLRGVRNGILGPPISYLLFAVIASFLQGGKRSVSTLK